MQSRRLHLEPLGVARWTQLQRQLRPDHHQVGRWRLLFSKIRQEQPPSSRCTTRSSSSSSCRRGCQQIKSENVHRLDRLECFKYPPMLDESLQIILIWEGPTRLLVLNSTQLSTSICVRARVNYCRRERKERKTEARTRSTEEATEMENI